MGDNPAGSRPSPIGLFDSGVGGLSVWAQVARLLPAHDLLYFADQKYVPYGSRPPAEIVARSHHIAAFLAGQGCPVVVVACNTASAAALEILRASRPDLAIVGMEPAVKPAAALTRRGIVGILATAGTLQGELFARTRQTYAREVEVIVRTAPGLVEQIERGETGSPETEAIVRAAVGPMVDAGADVLALGCTHYPFVAPLIRRLYGDDLQLLDPSEAVARQTRRVLGERGLLQAGADLGPGRRLFFTTGDAGRFAASLETLVGLRAEIRQAE